MIYPIIQAMPYDGWFPPLSFLAATQLQQGFFGGVFLTMRVIF